MKSTRLSQFLARVCLLSGVISLGALALFVAALLQHQNVSVLATLITGGIVALSWFGVFMIRHRTGYGPLSALLDLIQYG